MEEEKRDHERKGQDEGHNDKVVSRGEKFICWCCHSWVDIREAIVQKITEFYEIIS